MFLDMDGRELKVGDRILFATQNKTLQKGTIIHLKDGEFWGVSIKTDGNRSTRQPSERCYKIEV